MMEERDRMRIEMRNYFIGTFFLCILAVFFCGCAGKTVSDSPMESGESQDFPASEYLPDGYGWSARFEMAGKMAGNSYYLYRAGNSGDDFQLVGNTLYYRVSEWDMVADRTETALYKIGRAHV